MLKARSRFPIRNWMALSRLLSVNCQWASSTPLRVRTQPDSLIMLDSSTFPRGRPGVPFRRTKVDGVSGPKEMNRREAYPSQTWVTT